jgi:hypothetical protein
MVTANGHLKSYNVYISTKTPAGHQIDDITTAGHQIEFVLQECIKNNKKEEVNEHLLVEVSKKVSGGIKLKSLPDYIRDSVLSSSDRVVLRVISLRDSDGDTLKDFNETKERNESSTVTAEDQPELEYSGPPTRELLESITADAIESLGYEVASNTYRETTGGDSQEVDVWAEHPRTNFSMYASCKNWDSRVGRPTVQEEIGRIEDMKFAPQLRVLIVGTMTDEAETSVETNGFIPIILGEKANEENAEEIYQDVHSQLRETLLAIAPPDVENIANRADKISQDLRSLSKEIRNLESNMD